MEAKVKAAIEKLQGTPYRYSKDEIKQMILTSDKAVERGIVAIWKKQTDIEKLIKDTRFRNNIGFTAFHAKRGTYYANWINSGKHLTGKHLEIGRKLISHYIDQLTKIANKEI